MYLLWMCYFGAPMQMVSVVKDDHEILKEMVFTGNTAWYIIKYYRLGDTHQAIEYWINCYIES